MNFIKNHITPIFQTYLTLLVLLNILPINGKESVLNNNYILTVRLDYIGHAASIGLLTVLGLLYIKKKRKSLAIYTLVFVLLSFLLLSTGMEALQYVIPWRAFNVNDLMANGVGVLLGLLFFSFALSSRG